VHPEVFRIGPFAIRYYGLMYVIALLVGIGLARLEAKRRGLPAERMVDFAFYLFVGGLLGGRLYYVLLNWGYYVTHPLVPTWWRHIPYWVGVLFKICAIWEGGMAIHGGLIGGLVGGWLFARSNHMPYATLCDIAAPAVSLGHAFGRFGNFMNGDAHGYPLRSPKLPEWLRHFPDWMGVTFPPTSIAGREFGQVSLHPVMLYELVLNLLGFVLLWSLRKRPLPPGGLAGVYFIYYAVVRAFTSLFRADDLYLGPLRMPHVMSVVMCLVGLFLLLRPRRRITPS
jgi:phosphatidylglycerol:prolipoprotein diacylglycerol transferase